MNAAEQLQAAVDEYKAWRAAGGTRGSEADRKKRIHISGLVEAAQKERAGQEVVTVEDETNHEINPFEEAEDVRDAA